jgi:hypothetical protein
MSASLPVIRVFGGSLAHNRVEAEAALALHGMDAPLEAVYQRGGVLVRIHRIVEAEAVDPHGVQRPEGAPVIAPCEPGFLHCRLAEAALWVRPDARIKQDVPVNPPKDVVRPLLDGPWRVIRPLTGILETPALLPDGRLLAGRGYDVATGLLLDTLPIPGLEPSRRAAEAALKLLLEVFEGFPYVSEVDRSVALSAPLSLLEAPLIDATPAVGYSAPAAGSGKSLQAEATALIGRGRKPAAMPMAASEEEDKKRLLSVLMRGDSMALIDNVARPLESDALCAVITGARYEDRLLGVSRMVNVPARVMWAITGNNLRIVGDLIRRTLSCRIDPKCDRPETRRFDLDLHQVIPERRAELVHACLTIMASYQRAGRPKPLAALGNFEPWSRLVREPLVWLGMADPCDSYERLASDDPERELLGALMDAWWARFHDEKRTVKEVLAEADTGTTEQARALRDAVATVVAERGGRASPAQSLGFYLRSKADRVHGARRFVRHQGDTHAGAARWSLEQC